MTRPPDPAALLREATTLGLLDTDDHLRNWFDRLGRARDGAIKDYYTKQIVQRVQREQNARLGNPYLTAPPIASEGNILLGHQPNQMPIRLFLDGELNRHAIVSGASGTGKSNFALVVMLQVLAAGRRVWCFNPKGDTDALTVKHQDTLRIHPGFAWNPMIPGPGMNMSEHRYLFTKILASTAWGGEQTKIISAEAHRLTCAKHAVPSMDDLLLTLQGMPRKADPFDRRQTIQSLIHKLERFRDLYPGIFTCSSGIPSRTIMQHSLDLPAPLVSEPDQFIATLLISQLYHYRRSTGQRGNTEYLIVLEEGLQLMASSAHVNRIEPHPALSSIWMMARENGIAFQLLATSPSMIATTVTSSAYAQVALPMTDAADTNLIAKTFGLNSAQVEFMNRKQQTGQAVVRFGGRYRHPILITIPYVPLDKTVTAEQLRDAIRRTDAHNPHQTPMIHVHTALPSPEPTTPTAERIALNKTELAILHHLAKVVIDTVTNTYEATNTHYSQGDAAKKKLTQLGYASASPVIVREGRGGRAIALRISTTGYQRLGITPPRRPRATGPQGLYLVQKLSESLPGSSIELNLDGKAPDLILRVDSVQHAQFLLALNDHAHAFNGEEPKIPHNTLVGIEIECSDPTKTVRNNLTKDRAAGLQHLIFAVLPTDVQRVIQHLISSEQELGGVLVINALRLLDLLRHDHRDKS
jgi:hypothetical protein